MTRNLMNSQRRQRVPSTTQRSGNFCAAPAGQRRHGGCVSGEQTSLGRSVAVKVLKADAIADPNGIMLKRFEQEARAAGGLNHPHIVQIITTGRDGG